MFVRIRRGRGGTTLTYEAIGLEGRVGGRVLCFVYFYFYFYKGR